MPNSAFQVPVSQAMIDAGAANPSPGIGQTMTHDIMPGVGARTLNSQGVFVPDTSTSSSPAQGPGAQQKPAPSVFSADKATDFANNTMIPAMMNGLDAISHQNSVNSQNDLAHFLPGETIDAYNARAAAVNAAKGGNPVSQSNTNNTSGNSGSSSAVSDAAAKQIANTPDAGNQFIYDPNGQRLEVPIGSALPAGYSKIAPVNPILRGHTLVNSFNAANGTTYQQYSDGSYGTANADGTFAAPVSQDDYQKAYDNSPTAVLSSIANGIASLKNGPLPLNGPQQAQIDALNANLGLAVKAQQQANEAFTGGTAVAMNLYGMGNSVSGLGLIKATVDSGIQKIFTLQTQAADSIAKMQEQFNKDNYEQMYQFYTAYQTAVKDIDQNIKDMHTFAFQQKEHADQEADNLRTFNQKVEQDAITNKREDALAASTIATQAMERQKAAIEIKKVQQDLKNASFITNAANAVGGTTMGANDKPDPLKQQAYLQTIAKTNPGLALAIKQAANYQLDPTKYASLKNNSREAFINAVLVYDPNFDESQYATRAAMQKEVTSGPSSKTITAANTLIQHLNDLNQLSHGLNNSPIPLLNAPMNVAVKALGGKNPGNFDNALTAVATEAARIYNGSAPTEGEIQDWKKNLSHNSSPGQIQGYIDTVTQLMAGKLSTISDNYTQAMGKPAGYSFLTDRNASVLKNLGIDPVSVDPSYATSPQHQVSTFYQASPQNAQAVDAIMKVAPQATPEEVLNELESNGLISN